MTQGFELGRCGESDQGAIYIEGRRARLYRFQESWRGEDIGAAPRRRQECS
jgi:hypothetical protein